MHLEQRRKLGSELGKALQVLRELRVFAALLPQQHLLIYKLEDAGRIGLKRGVLLQVRFSQNAFSSLPALPLFSPHCFDQLRATQVLRHGSSP
jgi:hypothetical protein